MRLNTQNTILGRKISLVLFLKTVQALIILAGESTRINFIKTLFTNGRTMFANNANEKRMSPVVMSNIPSYLLAGSLADASYHLP